MKDSVLQLTLAPLVMIRRSHFHAHISDIWSTSKSFLLIHQANDILADASQEQSGSRCGECKSTCVPLEVLHMMNS